MNKLYSHRKITTPLYMKIDIRSKCDHANPKFSKDWDGCLIIRPDLPAAGAIPRGGRGYVHIPTIVQQLKLTRD